MLGGLLHRVWGGVPVAGRALGKGPLETQGEDGLTKGHRPKVARVGDRQGRGAGVGLVWWGYEGYGG